jgi:molybdopterin converting factor small subunit
MAVVRYFAAARAAAGTQTEEHPADTLEQLLADLGKRHGDVLVRVLQRSSYLVDGVACHDRQAPLPPGATVDVLPPFAGG